jgi:hypothetical protein
VLWNVENIGKRAPSVREIRQNFVFVCIELLVLLLASFLCSLELALTIFFQDTRRFISGCQIQR